MATVNYSVPDDVKAAFDTAFAGQNKSAVIAELMRTAVAETIRRKRREEMFELLTRRRRLRPSLADKALRKARAAGRP